MSRSGKRQASIVLFYPDGESYLKAMVLEGLNYRVFDPTKDVKYNLISIFGDIYQCLKGNSADLVKSLRSIRHLRILLRKCRARLIADQLRRMEPKAVITFIDNSNIFHLVCEACKEIPFLAIQNGSRTIWCATEALPDPDLIYHVDEYFCFGPQVQEMLEKHGHNIKRYTTCGSLVGGYFFSSHLAKGSATAKHHDLCIISQWHSHLSDIKSVPQRWANLGKAINVLTAYVARYTFERGISVCVALRSNNPAERDFYESHFKGSCVYQESDRLAFSSYKSVLAANLAIAINSTLASEAFGAGLKILFVNPFGEEWLQPTATVGSWYLSEPSYEEFSERVGELLRMELNTYLTEASSEMKNTMSFNPDRPAHVVIRERLIQLIMEPSRDD